MSPKSPAKSPDPFFGRPLIPGNPGNKGGGRPSNEFRDSLRLLLESPKVRKAVTSILENPKHPQFSTLWAKVMAYGYGAPAQTIEHTGGIDLNVHEQRETFEGRMARLATRLGAPDILAERN